MLLRLVEVLTAGYTILTAGFHHLLLITEVDEDNAAVWMGSRGMQSSVELSPPRTPFSDFVFGSFFVIHFSGREDTENADNHINEPITSWY